MGKHDVSIFGNENFSPGVTSNSTTLEFPKESLQFHDSSGGTSIEFSDLTNLGSILAKSPYLLATLLTIRREMWSAGFKEKLLHPNNNVLDNYSYGLATGVAKSAGVYGIAALIAGAAKGVLLPGVGLTALGTILLTQREKVEGFLKTYLGQPDSKSTKWLSALLAYGGGGIATISGVSTLMGAAGALAPFAAVGLAGWSSYSYLKNKGITMPMLWQMMKTKRGIGTVLGWTALGGVASAVGGTDGISIAANTAISATIGTTMLGSKLGGMNKKPTVKKFVDENGSFKNEYAELQKQFPNFPELPKSSYATFYESIPKDEYNEYRQKHPNLYLPLYKENPTEEEQKKIYENIKDTSNNWNKIKNEIFTNVPSAASSMEKKTIFYNNIDEKKYNEQKNKYPSFNLPEYKKFNTDIESFFHSYNGFKSYWNSAIALLQLNTLTDQNADIKKKKEFYNTIKKEDYDKVRKKTPYSDTLPEYKENPTDLEITNFYDYFYDTNKKWSEINDKFFTNIPAQNASSKDKETFYDTIDPEYNSFCDQFSAFPLPKNNKNEYIINFFHSFYEINKLSNLTGGLSSFGEAEQEFYRNVPVAKYNEFEGFPLHTETNVEEFYNTLKNDPELLKTITNENLPQFPADNANTEQKEAFYKKLQELAEQSKIPAQKTALKKLIKKYFKNESTSSLLSEPAYQLDLENSRFDNFFMKLQDARDHWDEDDRAFLSASPEYFKKLEIAEGDDDNTKTQKNTKKANAKNYAFKFIPFWSNDLLSFIHDKSKFKFELEKRWQKYCMNTPAEPQRLVSKQNIYDGIEFIGTVKKPSNNIEDFFKENQNTHWTKDKSILRSLIEHNQKTFIDQILTLDIDTKKTLWTDLDKSSDKDIFNTENAQDAIRNFLRNDILNKDGKIFNDDFVYTAKQEEMKTKLLEQKQQELENKNRGQNWFTNKINPNKNFTIEKGINEEKIRLNTLNGKKLFDEYTTKLPALATSLKRELQNSLLSTIQAQSGNELYNQYSYLFNKKFEEVKNNAKSDINKLLREFLKDNTDRQMTLFGKLDEEEKKRIYNAYPRTEVEEDARLTSLLANATPKLNNIQGHTQFEFINTNPNLFLPQSTDPNNPSGTPQTGKFAKIDKIGKNINALIETLRNIGRRTP